MIQSHGRHIKQHPALKFVRPIILAILVVTACVIVFFAWIDNADASTLAWGPPNSPGNIALNWAETQAGKWYQYGATGPNTYDCSGLVYEAFLKEGINISRDTYSMLATNGNGHFERVYTPERGDLAFYGTGHVEFATIWPNETFGAHNTGSRIGWIEFGYGWYPTMYFRVIRLHSIARRS